MDGTNRVRGVSAAALYGRYALMNLRCTLQYSAWPLTIVSSIIGTVVELLGMLILFRRFGNLGSWKPEHVMLQFGLASASFGLAEWFSRGFDVFPNQIASGDFDRLLLRPRTTFLQVMGQRFEFQRFGRVCVGLVCVGLAVGRLGVGVDLAGALATIGALLGGWFVYTGIFVFLSAISFLTMQPLGFMFIVTNATLGYARIPLPMLGNTLRRLLTFVLPFGLIYYYPAAIAAHLPGEAMWKGFMALPGGIVFFGISLLAWRAGCARYRSAGS